jgi:predicted TIM-barrel fold metal-dependent hydrolase
MIIDFEHHYFPEELVRRHGAKPGESSVWMHKGKPRLTMHDGLFNMEEHLRNMDIAGIDAAVLSGWDPPLEECHIINDSLARLQEEYRGRFIGLAHTQPLRGKEAIAELERAVGELGLKGAVITATVEGKPLDSTELYPFYEKMAQLGAPIYVHPSTIFEGFDFLNAPYDLYRSLGREVDVLTATTRLIMGGILEDFPSLTFVISHLGGGIAAVAERLKVGGVLGGGGPIRGSRMKKPFQEYLSRFYFNMAGYEGGMKAVACALVTLSPQQLLFATDYPQNFLGDGPGMKKYVEDIQQLPLPQEAKENMLGRNAARLLKLQLP